METYADEQIDKFDEALHDAEIADAKAESGAVAQLIGDRLGQLMFERHEIEQEILNVRDERLLTGSRRAVDD